MKSEVLCQACGKSSALGRLFCPYCGAKLDLAGVQIGNKRKSNGLFRFALGVLVIAILLMFGLMAWPVSTLGRTGSRGDARDAHRKLSLLYEAIQAGQAIELSISELEANAYLVENMTDRHENLIPGLMGSSLETVNLAFTSETVFVHICVRWHVAKVTLKWSCSFVQGEERVEWETAQMSVGRLPVPRALHRMIMAVFGSVIEQMENERYVLENLAEVRAGDGRIWLTTALAL